MDGRSDKGDGRDGVVVLRDAGWPPGELAVLSPEARLLSLSTAMVRDGGRRTKPAPGPRAWYHLPHAHC